MAEISSNRTIAKNTLMLCMRMAFTLIVSLYTSRVILSVLGVVDDGTYSIVGGTVSMFAFFSGALAGATSRFLVFELGQDDKERLKRTFSAAVLVHFILALVILVLLETIGLWLLNHKLVIPEERMQAARVVFQLSVFSTLLNITQVPYSASIISHERMGAFAYMSILEVSLKLLVCFLLKVSPIDKLIAYGILLLVVNLLIRMIYRFYCIRKFEECHFTLVKDWKIIKPLLTFSGWELFSSGSIIARDQGVDVVMNMFWGPVINSAAAKAGVICNAVNGFSNNFLTAIRPPIIKSYSAGDFRRMEELMIDASKYAFSLLALLSVPFFFESQFVIDLWLENPPQYTALFCITDLILVLIVATFRPLTYALYATGDIRLMSILNGLFFFSALPVSYLLLLSGHNPIAPWIAKCVIQLLLELTNLFLVKRNIREFNILQFLKRAVLPALISIAAVLPITYFVYKQFPDTSWWRFLAVCTASTISVAVTVFFIVFDKRMRTFVISKVKALLPKPTK